MSLELVSSLRYHKMSDFFYEGRKFICFVIQFQKDPDYKVIL